MTDDYSITLKPDPEQEAKALELASMIRECFASPAGERVLQHFQAILEQPVIHRDSTQFEAGIREGRRDLIRQIKANIKMAEGGHHG